MGCCGDKRAYLASINDDLALLYQTNNIIDLDNYSPKDVYEEFIVKYYMKSLKEKNIEGLYKLIDNKSLITINNFQHEWISLPKSLGDLSLFQLMSFFKNNRFINSIDDETNSNKLTETHEIAKDIDNNEFRNEYILFFIKKNNFLEKLYDILINGSYCQKDTTLLFLFDISVNIHTHNLIKSRETIDVIMNHLKGFFIKKYKNYFQHLIMGLQILRNIYATNEELRIYFIKIKGINYLENLLKNKNKNFLIINEILLNIENLIYKDDDNLDKENKCVNKIAITNVIDELIKLKLPEFLKNFFHENLKDEKINDLNNIFNRLFNVFYINKDDK